MNPAAWTDIGVTGILIAGLIAMIASVVKGWLVLGWMHTDITSELRARVTAQAETIRIQDSTIDAQAHALAKRASDDDLGVKVLESIRQLAGER